MKKINNYTFFWKDKIAQWNMETFKENDIVFCCAEGYMMYQKALLFKDNIKAEEILKSNSPREIQKLGREISNFNEELWNQHKENIVIQANMLKFSQNSHLLDILLSTEDTILVEASPYDKIWGVGLGQDDPLIIDEKNWKGQNLLGKCLMEVRKNLRK